MSARGGLSSFLPASVEALRTGTASDGRMLIKVGAAGHAQTRSLADIRSQLPAGWIATIYRPSGIDAVITHVGVDK